MKIFGQHEEQAIFQFQHVRERAIDAALIADGHVGYVVPIGKLLIVVMAGADESDRTRD